MAKKSRRALRKSGVKLPPLKVVSLRISPDTWTKCAWAALEKGKNRQEWVRDTLADLTRDAKAPNATGCKGLGTPSQQAEWQRTAERYGVTIDQFMVQAANMVTEKLNRQPAQNPGEQ